VDPLRRHRYRYSTDTDTDTDTDTPAPHLFGPKTWALALGVGRFLYALLLIIITTIIIRGMVWHGVAWCVCSDSQFKMLVKQR